MSSANELGIFHYSSEIERSIQKRKITRLLHFTHISNLIQIINSGLKNRAELNLTGAQYIFSDTTRMDGHCNTISFSIEYPNYMYLESLIQKNGSQYVILEYSIMLLKTATFYLHKSNPYIKRWGEATCFEDLFFPECRSPQLPSFYPSDPRAEIQIVGNISNEYLTHVFLPRSLNLNPVVKEVRRRNGELIVINDDIFLPRMDNDFWEAKKNRRESNFAKL